MPIALLVTMTPKPGCKDKLEQLLTETLVHVRREPGNLQAVVLRDPNEPDKVFELALYRDEEAIAAHLKTDKVIEALPIMKDLTDDFAPRRFSTVDFPESD